MALKTTPFDPADYITTPEGQADLLNDALASGHAEYIANALGIIARAHGIAKVAQGAGLSRMALYKALTKEGDPKLTTLMKVLETMNLRLMAAPRKPVGKRRAAAARGGKASRAAAA
ncbi:MAG TPA: addiction module antidote protein [Reyranellaceae bacterium]|nr:addiction module antidote protein [Reyranellaceae bacterium]